MLILVSQAFKKYQNHVQPWVPGQATTLCIAGAVHASGTATEVKYVHEYSMLLIHKASARHSAVCASALSGSVPPPEMPCCCRLSWRAWQRAPAPAPGQQQQLLHGLQELLALRGRHAHWCTADPGQIGTARSAGRRTMQGQGQQIGGPCQMLHIFSTRLL